MKHIGRGRGWHNESHRHSLAARGIKTSQVGAEGWAKSVEREETRLLLYLSSISGIKTREVHGVGAYTFYFKDGTRVDLVVDVDMGRIAVKSIGASPTSTGKGILVIKALKKYVDDHNMGLCAEEVSNTRFWKKVGFTQSEDYEDVWCYE